MKKKLIEIPIELFKQIEASAKNNVRSVNKEIIQAIKEHLKTK